MPTTQQCIATAQYPETENAITSLQSGWAEQSPEMWWNQTVQAIRNLNNSKKFNPKEIAAIGISYQMHGLVVVDKNQKCDKR